MTDTYAGLPPILALDGFPFALGYATEPETGWFEEDLAMIRRFHLARDKFPELMADIIAVYESLPNDWEGHPDL